MGENLALRQHFSENITQHHCDSYKNTSAQRIDSGVQRVLSTINGYGLNHELVDS